MRFDKAAILALDDEQMSQAEKTYLIAKFFPTTPRAPWQNKLRTQWQDSKRWKQYLGSAAGEVGTNPYRYTHDRLLWLAKQRNPEKTGNRVTDFSGWVFSLYRPKPTKGTLSNGQRVEREIAARFAPPPTHSGWELIYQDPLSDERVVKIISNLRVRGQPLKGVPDVVFREKKTGRILIVERKASNREIPTDGWPNLRAQLWAYAQIDDWANAPEVLLVGEIWGFTGTKVYPRAVRRWVYGEPQFERQNAELFGLYCGERA